MIETDVPQLVDLLECMGLEVILSSLERIQLPPRHQDPVLVDEETEDVETNGNHTCKICGKKFNKRKGLK
jgi:hypothetical protein